MWSYHSLGDPESGFHNRLRILISLTMCSLISDKTVSLFELERMVQKLDLRQKKIHALLVWHENKLTGRIPRSLCRDTIQEAVDCVSSSAINQSRMPARHNKSNVTWERARVKWVLCARSVSIKMNYRGHYAGRAYMRTRGLIYEPHSRSLFNKQVAQVVCV